MILFKKAPYKVKWDKVSTFDISQELLRRHNNGTIHKSDNKSSINFCKFKKGKIAIYCKNELDSKKFLLECDKHDIKMGGLFKASDFHYDVERPCYYYIKEPVNGLSYDPIDWFKSQAIKIKEYSEVTK